MTNLIKNRWLSFEEAHKIVLKEAKKKKITNVRRWWKRCRATSALDCIPVRPDKVYKDGGWVSWGHWLGTNNRNPLVRKYRVNDDYFKIWSHDMAYILGFWFADGCIFGDRFNISQHKKETYILEVILEKMNSNYPVSFIGKDKNNCRFDILSKDIVSDIIKLGGKENKSIDMKFPKIPSKYLRNFIRGLWDGDGSVCYDRINKAYRSVLTCGSKDFVYLLYDALKAEIPDLKGKVYKDHVYRIRFCKYDTIKLGEFMYKNLGGSDLKLNRKYEKFKLAGAKI